MAAATGIVLVGAGTAYAYWTTTGSGTGTAKAGTSVPVTVTQDSTVNGLYPDGPAVPIDFTVNNPSPGAQFITSVSIAVTGTSSPTCTAANFDVDQPTITPANLASGATAFTGASTGAAIHMIDTGANQDACKSVTVNLSYSVN
ncbi:hypothetical protein ACPPVT_08700 [Angustibacter sp. McL0619]|uniref:hypothetical protein n=1 Tax=Angustibacter sp. McL0619 TaxID=3415676 RepID=UPI003CEB401F